ncbi:polyadenylate-binding protein RBP47B-like isoform X2 [Euphorbia lathyris]|uniref:polyadenylate-binding protein RBP47B-like isoform X2 n=1 Tax=Euphorbia lathyris TaxID=212925 RepID=UPI0033131DD7
MAQGSLSEGDSSNTTIFVERIDADISDEDLRQPFSQFGEVLSVEIPIGKGYYFVQFANRKSAEDALQSLNGIGKPTLRLSLPSSFACAFEVYLLSLKNGRQLDFDLTLYP